MKSILFKILVSLIISFNAFTVSSNNRPRIIWASSPVGPDETVMIQAGDFSNTATIQLARVKDSKPGNPERENILAINDWVEVEILQRSSSNLKCVVPAIWKPGIYACRIVDGETFSDTIFLNGPKVWWSQGENGETSSPGGWLRIVGNCLKIKSDEVKSHKCKVSLRNSQGKSFPLFIERADPFDIQVHIPAQVASGTYELWINNGYGGKSGWNHGVSVQITDVKVSNLKVFDVMVLGIESALQKARENNGGIVYFPSGEYEIKNAIEIPENTVVRGDGIDKTIVYWNDLVEIPEALLYGKSFSIENLSLYCQNMYKNVIKVDDGYFKIDSVRIRANPIFLLGRTDRESEFRGRKLNGKIEDIDACIHLNRVNHFEVSNCDILAGSYGIRLMNSSNGLIRDSKVRYGRDGFGCEAINRVIFENCVFEGIDLGATGNYFATYFGNSAEYLLLKRNRFANAYGLDQEFFTFDATGGAYMGKIANTDGKNLTLASDPVFKRYSKEANDWRNTVVCILDGKGSGQYRRVVSHSGRMWEMDQPWLVDPDTSSIISIIPFRGHALIVNNTFEDGGAVQFYGTSIENIVANNKGTRMSGFLVWGQEQRGWGWQPSWYNQVLNNEITNGHNYRHQLTRFGVMGTVSDLHQGNYEGPLSKCIVLRNNKVQSNGLISISGQSEDVLVEKNLIRNSEFGIVVEGKLQKGVNTDAQYYKDHSMSSESKKKFPGILLRYNQFERVDNHYSGEAISGVKIYKY
ncbi:MAG: hypothetical protein M0R21_13185 [Lentimicrobiaceae bacterium]|nr:hypothetical protein [Lentimicrobiaceae bacterium]